MQWVRPVKNRIRYGGCRSRTSERLRLRLFGIFAVGCVLGSCAALLWPECMEYAIDWLTSQMESVRSYRERVLWLLRMPVFLCLCAAARRGQMAAQGALCLQGACLSYAVCGLLRGCDLEGWLPDGIGLLFSVFLRLPLLFGLAYGCLLRRKVAPMDGAMLGRLIGILILCMVLALLEPAFSLLGGQ